MCLTLITNCPFCGSTSTQQSCSSKRRKACAKGNFFGSLGSDKVRKQETCKDCQEQGHTLRRNSSIEAERRASKTVRKGKGMRRRKDEIGGSWSVIVRLWTTGRKGKGGSDKSRSDKGEGAEDEPKEEAGAAEPEAEATAEGGEEEGAEGGEEEGVEEGEEENTEGGEEEGAGQGAEKGAGQGAEKGAGEGAKDTREGAAKGGE